MNGTVDETYTQSSEDMYGTNPQPVYVSYTYSGGAYHAVIDGFSGSECIYLKVSGYCNNYADTFESPGWALFEAAPTPPEFEPDPEIDGNYDIRVEWSTPDSTDNLQGFDLYRSISTGGFDLLFFFWPFDNYYDDNLLDYDGAKVRYQITAYNYLYASSEWDEDLYLTVYPPPLIPTELDATSTENGMLVEWTDNSHCNASYTIYRAENGSGNYGTLTTTVPGTASQYLDTSVSYYSTYSYKIKAVGEDGVEESAVTDPTDFVRFEY